MAIPCPHLVLPEVLHNVRVNSVKEQCKQLRGGPIPLLDPHIGLKTVASRKHTLAPHIHVPDDLNQLIRHPQLPYQSIPQLTPGHTVIGLL